MQLWARIPEIQIRRGQWATYRQLYGFRLSLSFSLSLNASDSAEVQMLDVERVPQKGQCSCNLRSSKRYGDKALVRLRLTRGGLTLVV